MNILLFLLDNVKYGIEVQYCKEIDFAEHITYIEHKNKSQKFYVEGITNLRGEIITVMNLKKLLFEKQSENHNQYLIVLNFNKKKLGLLVDEVIDIINIERENINYSKGSIDQKISKFIKFTVLYNHEPILLLDPETL